MDLLVSDFQYLKVVDIVPKLHTITMFVLITLKTTNVRNFHSKFQTPCYSGSSVTAIKQDNKYTLCVIAMAINIKSYHTGLEHFNPHTTELPATLQHWV
jgi:hypothetical protein